MKFGLIAILAVAMMSCVSLGYAATQQSITQQKPAKSSESMTQMKAQLEKIIKTLDNLQGSYVKSSAHLGMLADHFQTGANRASQSGGFYLDGLPSVTYELALLEAEKHFNPRGLTFGGYLELDTQYWNGDRIKTASETYQHGSGTYLTTFDFSMMERLNHWVSAVAREELKNVGETTQTLGVHSAFVMLGNLESSPFYASVGKMYVPWGTFGGNGLWAVSLVRSVFRPHPTNEFLMGYSDHGLNTTVSVFDNRPLRHNVTDFTYAFSYGGNVGKTHLRFGAGYLNDVRGTSGTLGSAFAVGGSFAAQGNKRNAAYDLNGDFAYGIFNMSGEYIFTQRTVKLASTGVNQGKPRAWDVATYFTPTVRGKVVTLALSYSHTSNLAGLPMGLAGRGGTGGATSNIGLRSQWIAYVNRSITKQYNLGLEAVYDNLYNNLHTYAFTIDNSIYF